MHEYANDLVECLERARQTRARVVLVTGVFDLLHAEHQNFLRAARAEGDVLLVGVESDRRVRQLKGEDRPIQSVAVRMTAIRQTELADCVFALPEEFSTPEAHEEVIAFIRPAVLAVSSSSRHLAEKHRILRAHGGEVHVVLSHNPSISTTQRVRARGKIDATKI